MGDCIVDPGDPYNQPVLINQTEYMKTAGNVSDLNQVYLGFHDGLQYSVLGPAHIPDDFDFQTTSYGSHTECHLVTTQCGAVSAPRARFAKPWDFNFVCNNTMAGLNMTGNFANLGQATESYANSASNVSDGMRVEDINTMNPSSFGFGFQYFKDSAKQIQGANEYIADHYFWAMAFSLDIYLYHGMQSGNPWAKLNLVASTRGGPEGIMSCVTNISEIVRLSLPFLSNSH